MTVTQYGEAGCRKCPIATAALEELKKRWPAIEISHRDTGQLEGDREVKQLTWGHGSGWEKHLPTIAFGGRLQIGTQMPKGDEVGWIEDVLGEESIISAGNR